MPLFLRFYFSQPYCVSLPSIRSRLLVAFGRFLTPVWWQTIYLRSTGQLRPKSIVATSAVDHGRNPNLRAAAIRWHLTIGSSWVVVILSRLPHRIVVVNDSGALLYYPQSLARRSAFTFYREDCLKGASCKVNIIFLRGPLFFRPFFLGRPALTSRHPSPTASRVPGRMIAMSSQADEVRLERFNIVLTSIRYRGRGNPFTRWHCKPYQFNFMRTLSRTLRSPPQYSGRLSWPWMLPAFFYFPRSRLVLVLI